jgi:hypothetical protein
MTIKTLSAIAILTASLSGPVFAGDMTANGLTHHKSAYTTRHFRSSYDQAPGFYAGARAENDWFAEAYGFDRSRVGGRDPDLNPAAN